MGSSIKLIIALLAAAGTAAAINASVKAKSQSKSEKIKELNLQIFEQKKGIIELIKDFLNKDFLNNIQYPPIEINDIIFSEITLDDEPSDELILSLTNYVTKLSELRDCFQYNSELFMNELPEGSGMKWSYHLKVAFWIIVTLADETKDLCKPLQPEEYNTEYIKDQLEKIGAVLEHHKCYSEK